MASVINLSHIFSLNVVLAKLLREIVQTENYSRRVFFCFLLHKRESNPEVSLVQETYNPGFPGGSRWGEGVQGKLWKAGSCLQGPPLPSFPCFRASQAQTSQRLEKLTLLS